MPNMDGTGPQGLGPMSGRGLGRCVAKQIGAKRTLRPSPTRSTGSEFYGIGRGGRPRGGGRGNCFGGGNGCRDLGRGRRFGR